MVTATPTPENWVLATNTPKPRIVTATPTAENEATATVMAAIETAIALTTGTPDPNIIVVTNTPTQTATPTSTPPPTKTPTPTTVYVTPTTYPADVFDAATRSAEMTAQAESAGTATPLPANWRMARVVVAPNIAAAANQATRTAASAQSTAIALTTAQPENMVIWTATPRPPLPARPRATSTSLFIDLADMTATPVVVTAPFPSELMGKILFLSNLRTGNPSQPGAYVMNPDGTGVARLTSRDFYDRANMHDAISPDGRLAVDSMREQSGTREIQIFYTNQESGNKHQLTYHGDGVAWDAAWSPVDDRILYVSNEGVNDEIWVIRPGNWPGEKLTGNDWEWDHSPSWSPDGSQIIFSSNQGGKQRIWTMNPNGGSPRPLVDLPFEAWGPIWVKYAD